MTAAILPDLSDLARHLELPVRWASPLVAGDYEGRERTLEVFLADAAEQRALLRRIRPLRSALEAAAGGPIIVVFHTFAETFRLYPEMVPSPAAGTEAAPLLENPVWAPPTTGRPPRHRRRAA